MAKQKRSLIKADFFAPAFGGRYFRAEKQGSLVRAGGAGRDDGGVLLVEEDNLISSGSSRDG